MIPFRFLAVLAALALTAAACGGSTDTASTPTTPAEATAVVEPTTEPAPTAEPEPTAVPDIELGAGLGSYQVGVTTLVLEDTTGRERPLTVDVWFPLATDADTDLPAHEYTFLPGSYYPSPFAVSAEPAVISGDGPFPMVVYSHGSGGIRYIHSNYTEAIASHGYVVVAPDHTGNTSLELITGGSDDGPVIALNRPQDVTAVIDAFLDAASGPAGDFTSSIDPERIALTGHSFGGFTSLAVVSGYENDLGSYPADTRVDAIIPLAPASSEQLLSDDQLAAVTVPTLVIVGTDDKTTPVDPNVTRIWELASSDTLQRLELVAAEHQTFTDVCEYQVFLPQLPAALPQVVEFVDSYAEDGCAPGDMPIARAQAITNTFAITFLESVFNGAPPIDPLQVDEQDDIIYSVR